MALNGNSTRIVILVLATLVGGVADRAEAGDYNPPVREAVLVPKFCWHQFMGDKFSGPQFEIPKATCGAFTNHYCYALIDLNEANRSIGNEAKKRAALLRAKENTLYTLRGIRGFPHCPIRRRAETTLRIIEDQLRVLP